MQRLIYVYSKLIYCSQRHTELQYFMLLWEITSSQRVDSCFLPSPQFVTSPNRRLPPRYPSSVAANPFHYITAASRYRAMLCIERTVLSKDVCPSVCPSVTCRYSVETAKRVIKHFHNLVATHHSSFSTPNSIIFSRDPPPPYKIRP